ncbi:MAG: PD-(D/E)XK nuclease family protein, partial [bacterium]|nr:PD-(D/E)XK nuclease family protein [bacterium]
FILNIPTPSSSAQSFGTSIHATLRDFLKSKMEGKDLAEKDLLEMLENNWISEGYKDKKHEELVHKKGVRMLKDFYHQTKGSKVLPLVLEQPFNFPLGKIKMVGRLDRVDPAMGGKIEIIDYKTGASVPSQKDVDQNLQMTIYALAATEVKEEPFGKRPEEVLLSLHFIETGEKITTTRTKEQLEKAKKEILEIVEEIEKSDFKCSPSIFCKHCEFQLLCEAEG